MKDAVGCKACVAESWSHVFGDPTSDYAIGMRDAWQATIDKGHTCRDAAKGER